jgi:NADH-quinone oxidoreductase subunit A
LSASPDFAALASFVTRKPRLSLALTGTLCYGTHGQLVGRRLFQALARSKLRPRAKLSDAPQIYWTREMPLLLEQYLPLVIFAALSAIIAGALLVAPFLLAFKAPDPEKLSAYECGFNPFNDARMKFDVRFYLVSLLFIVFDLEVAFLFPWAVAFKEAGVFGFWAMMAFLGVLTIGFVYEWRKGALEWD